MAKKKLDNLMKESKIRDREDPDSFTIAALPPAGKPTDKTGSKVDTDSVLTFSFQTALYICNGLKKSMTAIVSIEILFFFFHFK